MRISINKLSSLEANEIELKKPGMLYGNIEEDDEELNDIDSSSEDLSERTKNDLFEEVQKIVTKGKVNTIRVENEIKEIVM